MFNQTQRIGMTPLVGNTFTDEARWLGASLAHLLSDHLLASGIDIISPNLISQHMLQKSTTLPLTDSDARTLRNTLGLLALIYGEYTLDQGSKSLGVRLTFSAPGFSSVPLEAAAPLNSFGRYIERLSLAILNRLDYPITQEVRQAVGEVYRPANFEAFQQLAQARMAWSRGEHELALAAVESALDLDANYEEAAAVRVATAREAEDLSTVVAAFRQWVGFAKKSNDLPAAAERTILLGHWMVERSEWGEARRAFREAGELYRRARDKSGETRAKNNLAALDITVGNTGPAITIMRRNLRTTEDHPLPEQDEAEVYFNLAVAHKMQGQRDEALRALEESMRVARDIGDNNLQARIVAQRGTLRDDMGQWAEAMADYARAANLFDALSDDIGRGLVRMHQAILYKRQGMYDRAEKILQETLKTLAEAPHPPPHDQGVVWLNTADLYIAMGNYEQAWGFATRAHDRFEALDSPLLERAVHLLEELTALADDDEQQ